MIGELRSLGSLTGERLADDWLVRRAVAGRLSPNSRAFGQDPRGDESRSYRGLCVARRAQWKIEPYRETVGFRNMVVHRYDRIDSTVLVDIVNNHLTDFDLFRDEVLAYCAR